MPKDSKKKSLKNYPSRTQWKQLFKVLNKKEKTTFSVFLILAIISFSFLTINFYLQHTKVQPAIGGSYSEGLVGQPRFLNPIYAQTNDIDRDLVELLFSGLMKHTPDGELVPQLAEEYQILEDGKVYEFTLKDNLVWHDKKPFTVDDVIFTIETIQNPDFKSPLRISWSGIKVDKISDTTLRFRLQKPSSIFLEYCTVKIVPEHIWSSISPENFQLSTYNLKPIGSGPYKLESLEQDSEGKIKLLNLARNPFYFEEGPYVSKITFYFFNNQEDLLKAYLNGKIKGFALSSTDNLPKFNLGLKMYSFSMPRYFALFLNPENSKALSEDAIKKALNYGIDKQAIIQKLLLGYGKIVDSPVMPQIYGLKQPSETYQFNQEKAKQILDEAGFKENEDGYRIKYTKKATSFQFKSNLQLKSSGNEVTELQKCLAQFPDVYPEGDITGYFGSLTKAAVIRFQEKYADEVLAPYNLTQGTGQVKTSTRAKLNELCNTKEETLELKFSLATVDQPLLINTASLLKNQLKELGIEINIETFDLSTLQQEIIKKREYEMLLFGEVLGSIPDPFPFWHSSQKKDPGLNLSLYENKEADKLLEEIRESFDKEITKEKLEQFQNILIQDSPAVFLYNPDYLYLVSSEIKGIGEEMITDPSKRLSNMENWYIKTKRVLR